MILAFLLGSACLQLGLRPGRSSSALPTRRARCGRARGRRSGGRRSGGRRTGCGGGGADGGAAVPGGQQGDDPGADRRGAGIDSACVPAGEGGGQRLRAMLSWGHGRTEWQSWQHGQTEQSASKIGRMQDYWRITEHLQRSYSSELDAFFVRPRGALVETLPGARMQALQS